MSRFIFLVSTGSIPRKQKIVLNITAGLVFLIGFLICSLSFICLFPSICDVIGFNSKGMPTFVLVISIGLIFCFIAYFMAFLFNLSWKKEANSQLKYEAVFKGDSIFKISNSFLEEWSDSIRSAFKETGIINLTCLKGAFGEKMCFVDCRYVGVLNEGGDYSLVIIKNETMFFDEKKYFRTRHKALDYLKNSKNSRLILKFLQDLDIDVSIIIDNDSVTLKKLHKFTKAELNSAYISANQTFEC